MSIFTNIFCHHCVNYVTSSHNCVNYVISKPWSSCIQYLILCQLLKIYPLCAYDLESFGKWIPFYMRRLSWLVREKEIICCYVTLLWHVTEADYCFFYIQCTLSYELNNSIWCINVKPKNVYISSLSEINLNLYGIDYAPIVHSKRCFNIDNKPLSSIT